MVSLNSRHCLVLGRLLGWLLAAALCMTGCGKQERTEAVQLAKALTGKKANFADANAIEKDFISSARAWCSGITANGAGRGAELDQNAAVAAGLAKSALAISAQLSQVREAIDSQPLKEEYPRTVRNELTTQLTKRQRLLQDMRALLEQAAPQFLEYKQSKTYAGDTYPDGVGKVDALLGAYKPPEDALGTALAALQSKYSFSASEL
ncbi:MAG TPA: hypothetical protein VNY05_39155 [Candidatus Acidoferrales bacterium]|jgi:hypothetical protein|nr:hypothetical protein [Candidatus Acidoferrales bacterium]